VATTFRRDDVDALDHRLAGGEVRDPQFHRRGGCARRNRRRGSARRARRAGAASSPAPLARRGPARWAPASSASASHTAAGARDHGFSSPVDRARPTSSPTALHATARWRCRGYAAVTVGSAHCGGKCDGCAKISPTNVATALIGRLSADAVGRPVHLHQQGDGHRRADNAADRGRDWRARN
jgi:hypothetical protein